MSAKDRRRHNPFPRYSFKSALLKTLFGNAAGRLFGAIGGILVARFLGPAGRGELAAVYYYPTLISIVGSMGIEQAAAYGVSRRPEEKNSIARSAFWSGALLGLPQLVVGLAAAHLLLPEDKAHLVSTVQWFMFFPFVVFCKCGLRGIDQGTFSFDRYNLLAVLPTFVYAAGILGVWTVGAAGVASFTLCNLGSQVLALLLSVALSWEALRERLPCWSEIKAFVLLGARLHLPHVALTVFSMADMFMAIQLMSSMNVGLYAVAVTVAELQLSVASAFLQVGFVNVSKEVDKAAARAAFLMQFRVAQLIMVGVGLALALIAGPGIRIVFGAEFLPAREGVYWLIGASALFSLSIVLDIGMRALGSPLLAGLGHVGGTLVLVVVAHATVPVGGIKALGIAKILGAAANLGICIVATVFAEKFRPGELWGFRMSVLRSVIG